MIRDTLLALAALRECRQRLLNVKARSDVIDKFNTAIHTTQNAINVAQTQGER